MIIIGTVFVLLDQFIKRIISSSFSFGETRSVIGDFFHLTYTRNEGAAWGIFSGQIILLIIIALLALVFIYLSFIKDKKLNNLEIIIYSVLIGGILGNLIDRIMLGYVVDYLSFNIFGYNFPVFNLADMGIVTSAFFILFFTIKEEIECRKSKSKKT